MFNVIFSGHSVYNIQDCINFKEVQLPALYEYAGGLNPRLSGEFDDRLQGKFTIAGQPGNMITNSYRRSL